MKSPYVGDLVPNEVVTAQFLVISKEVRQKKTGEPYLSLQFSDRTGEIEAKMWDNVAEVMNSFDRDDFVKVKGLAQLYQNRSQFTVHKLRRLEEHEVEPADYFPCSSRDPEEMFAELWGIINGLQNRHLQDLLRAVFSDGQLANCYKTAPAAKSIHHACRGGLLEHVLSLCQLCRLTASHYKHIDLDLLLTGAILHDIGKVEELQYARSFGYSVPGQLIGHIVIGLRMVAAKFDRLPDFPLKLRMLVEHMILSHHGLLEFGSPKVPMFLEALLLHHLDNLDSKMESMRVAIERDASTNDFTGWIAPLERVVLKKEHFLNEDTPSPAAAPNTPVSFPEEPIAPPVSAPPVKPRAVNCEPHPATPTLFGEKLQAVLGERK